MLPWLVQSVLVYYYAVWYLAADALLELVECVVVGACYFNWVCV